MTSSSTPGRSQIPTRFTVTRRPGAALPSGRFLAPHSGALGFSVLAKEFERERTGRRGRFGTGPMGHDGVRNGTVCGGSGIGVEYLLSQPVRYGDGDSACVYEDPLVREGGEQTAPVSDADRGVQCDRLPNSVDIAFGDTVPPKDRSSQIGALDLETSLACGVSPSPRSCRTVAAKSRSSS